MSLPRVKAVFRILTLFVIIFLLLIGGLPRLERLLPTIARADGPTTFSNTSSITIPAGAPGTTSGNADPYPSNITVSGMSGVISNVTVSFLNVDHTNIDDLDILLVSPTTSKNLIVLSDTGGGTNFTGLNLTFDDAAAAAIPDSGWTPVSGTFKPSNYTGGAADAWGSPAPTPSAETTFAGAFNGISPNGTWSLYIVDDAGGDVGSFAGGWSLTITTVAQPDLTATKTNNVGGSTPLGNSWTWTITVANGGGADASFTSGQTIFSDNLPDSNISYGSVSVGSVTNVTNSGSISCSISSNNLTCTASGATVTIGATTGTFQLSFTATPSATGTFANPRGGGSCSVDPNGNVTEGNESNNSCSNTVTVTAASNPDLTATKTNNLTSNLTPLESSWTWKIAVANGGSGAATFTDGQTILSDNLPNTNISYGAASAGNFTNITGSANISCSISSNNLTCTANGGSVVMGATTGAFEVTFTATASATGTFANPRAGGSCSVDPNNNVTETNDGNNACSNTVTVVASTSAGQIMISEFRFRGSSGSNAAEDEFIELYNNTSSNITVAANDGGAGWALVASDGTTRATIPNGTVIKARSYYLLANSDGYSLTNYPSGNNGVAATTATPDLTYTADIADGAGIALFKAGQTANFTLANRLDAVGFSGVADSLYREGTGLTPSSGISTSGEFTFFRDITSGSDGRPKDANDNATDFLFVATNAAVYNGRQATLGAPGPQNSTSPTIRNNLLGLIESLLDSQKTLNQSPNREIFAAGTGGYATGLRTIEFRRSYTNTSGQSLTRLRFRIIGLTTTPRVGSNAELVVITSVARSGIALTSGGTADVLAVTLETPPAQAAGGGLNSTVSVGTITLAAPLANNASVNVNFAATIINGGPYRFFINFEALN